MGHPAGPHANARMVSRARMSLAVTSAAAPKRMINRRAWRTTRPGRAIRWKRSAFIRLAAQSLPNTNCFITLLRLWVRIVRAHQAALAPNLPDGNCLA